MNGWRRCQHAAGADRCQRPLHFAHEELRSEMVASRKSCLATALCKRTTSASLESVQSSSQSFGCGHTRIT